MRMKEGVVSSVESMSRVNIGQSTVAIFIISRDKSSEVFLEESARLQ